MGDFKYKPSKRYENKGREIKQTFYWPNRKEKCGKGIKNATFRKLFDAVKRA